MRPSRQRCVRRDLRIIARDGCDLYPGGAAGDAQAQLLAGLFRATIAAGGALKALIPPSLSMILYCVVARTYIFDVFIAAVIPALITIAANLIAIAVMTRLDPAIAPVSERLSRQDKLASVRRAAPAALLIAIIFAGSTAASLPSTKRLRSQQSCRLRSH